MANILCEGWDQYTNFNDNTIWVNRGTAAISSSVAFGTGKYASTSARIMALFPALSTVIIGARLMVESNQSGATSRSGIAAWTVTGSTTQAVVFGFGQDGSAVVFVDNTMVWQSAFGLYSNSVAYYFEAEFTRTGLIGRINGVEVVNVAFADIGADYVTGGVFCRFTTGTLLVDDVYINDTTGTENTGFLGEVTVFTLFPDADTADADWTLVGGATAWGILDNSGPNLSQYLETATAGDTTTVDIEAFPVTVFQIFTVWTQAYVDKSSSATAEMRVNIIQNAVTGNGAIGVLAENTPQYFADQYALDPDSGLAWNPGTFNPQIQLERTT